VSGGLVPIALGNDGLGSIRIPAACCGLVGIKPGPNVIPADIGANSWYGMTENGPLATTVADLALMFSVLADRAGYADIRVPDRPLRIGLALNKAMVVAPVDDGWADGVRQTAEVLSAAGHTVEEAPFPYPLNTGPILARWFGGASYDAEGLDRKAMERRTRIHALLGDAVRRFDLVKDSQKLAWTENAKPWFRRYDVLLTPSLARPPISSQEWGRGSWAASVWANIRFAPFAAPWNLLDWPAVSVPSGVHPRGGTPTGAQLVCPPGGEMVLMGLAAQIEAARPWTRLAPGYDT
jgi:amidase